MAFSYINLGNLALIEQMHRQYLEDPQNVEPSWRYFFEGAEFASLFRGPHAESPDLRVYHLIEAYRVYGHLASHFNPMDPESRPAAPELALEKYGFKKEELSENFPTCGFLSEAQAPLQNIIEALEKTYCRTIGIEYMNMGEPKLEEWLQKRIEPGFELNLSPQDKLEILKFLNKAEIFESFIHTKYVGQKRFSLEGEETLIPVLAEIIQVGAQNQVEEVVLGMSHRGRLNVLANILNKSYVSIFNEFEDFYVPNSFEGTGDVKYHKGFVGHLSENIKVTLSANPSHLESVDPVVEGITRAKQLKKTSKAILPILIHGDAAISGQGVVYETLQLARLNGYQTGGTIHIVVNNQIGFTTIPKDSRSTRYCTDIAKTAGSPVFHVNAEDPEGCVAVAKIAIEMRQLFGCDVFIDLNGYRKYGHNESDEPNFTQPLEYQLIGKKKNIRDIYRDKLIEEGILDKQSADALEEEFRTNLHKALDSVKESKPAAPPEVKKSERVLPPATAVSAKVLQDIAQKFCTVPSDFHLHPKIQKHIQERLKMVQADPSKPTIDWGMGEHLAFGAILWEGIHVRLSGQDCRRGTFSHRHAVWVDQADEQRYFPLSHLKKDQGLFDIYNSPLSEFAVLGFDFGYSLDFDKVLVIWEAQFGDFFNGAQIIVDQYISTCEQKWGLRSNITLLLPHGYEGQGPEHSSARIERFLESCGDDNMLVANCSTPAQFFHLLRRQALWAVKKPLIVFTPKALLRHPLALSSLNDFTQGKFQEILDDPTPSAKAKKLLFCSGKIFYDLIQEREKRQTKDVAIVRIEQLYPLDLKQIRALLSKYQGYETCMWVQEEHMNMGAWSYLQPIFEHELNVNIQYAGRVRSASPAAGSHALHKKQHGALLEKVFGEKA